MVRKEKKKVGEEFDLEQLPLTIYLPSVHASCSYSRVIVMGAHKVLRVLSSNPWTEELAHGMLKAFLLHYFSYQITT